METVTAVVERLRLTPGNMGDAVETATAVGERLSPTRLTSEAPWKR